MHSAAVAHAERRLGKARLAMEAMRVAKSPTEIEAHWEDFLIAASGFYSKLEQGAKGNGKSKAWFGRKKHDRKTDPLLCYLHQARNAEEHGIQEITGRTSTHVTIPPGGSAKFVSDGKNKWTVEQAQGEIKFANDVVTLVRVQDARYGDWFDPPTEHLGHPLTDLSPVALAGLGLAYLDQMLAEARAL